MRTKVEFIGLQELCFTLYYFFLSFRPWDGFLVVWVIPPRMRSWWGVFLLDGFKHKISIVILDGVFLYMPWVLLLGDSNSTVSLFLLVDILLSLSLYFLFYFSFLFFFHWLFWRYYDPTLLMYEPFLEPLLVSLLATLDGVSFVCFYRC